MHECDTVQDELEVALKLNGTSFIGLGWKPTEGVVSTCTGQIPERTPVGKSYKQHR